MRPRFDAIQMCPTFLISPQELTSESRRTGVARSGRPPSFPSQPWPPAVNDPDDETFLEMAALPAGDRPGHRSTAACHERRSHHAPWPPGDRSRPPGVRRRICRGDAEANASTVAAAAAGYRPRETALGPARSPRVADLPGNGT